MNEPVLLRARFASFCVDEAQARLSRDGTRVEVAPRAFSVLCELVRHAGQLVPEGVLLDRVWGHRHVSESVVRTVVSQLRHALGDDPRNPRFVETTARRGYRFIARVAREDDSAASDDGPSLAVLGAAPAAAAIGSEAAPTPLFGRRAVLARVQAAWRRAMEGRHQFVLVSGEAGIGKSAVIEHVLASLPAGVGMGIGQCVEHYGAAEPYMPILEVLNGLCRAADGHAMLAMLRLVAPTWLTQMPWLLGEEDRRALRQEAVGATQDRMLRELGELFDRARAASPVVVVLEDLHWSDHATVQALAYLARRRGSSPVLIVGTYRPTELIAQQHPLGGLRHELTLHRLCEEIALEPLTENDLAAWLADEFGARPPDGFVQTLHAHTSGLPLFVSHVVEDWTRSGALALVDGAWRVPVAEAALVPSGITHVIEQQLGRLTQDERRLLAAASVGGREFSVLALAAVLERTPEDVEDELGRLCGRLPWLACLDIQARADGRLDGLYGFRHSLYRRAILQGLPLWQSTPWHRAWARVLEGQRGADPASLAASIALHLERGREPAAAAARLVDVATRAIELGAAHEAIRIARHGIALLAIEPDRACEQSLRVLEAIALTRVHVVSAPEVAEAFARTDSFDDIQSSARMRAMHGRWWVCFSRGELDAAIELAERIRLLGEQSGDALLHSAGLGATGMTLAMRGDIASARAALQAALEAHRSSRPDSTYGLFVQDPVVEAGDALALVSWVGGDFATARIQATRAIDLAAEIRHPLSEVTALYMAACLHALAAEFDVVEGLVGRLREVIERHALSTTSSGFDWLHGRALVARGRIEDGLVQMRHAAASARECGLLATLDGFYYHHAEACRVAGDMEGAAASAREGIGFASATGARLFESGLWRQLALALAARGDQDEAASAIREAVAVARRQGAAFHEILAHAAAREHGWHVEEPQRLETLLAATGADPSPALAASCELIA